MIDRRSFLLLTLGASLGLASEPGQKQPPAKAPPKPPQGFALLEVRGSYREIGTAIGKRFASNMHTVIKRRAAWHKNLMDIIATPAGRQLSEQLLQLTRKHFPHYLEEIRGMADGSGIDFAAMWAMTIKSELAALPDDPPGCSTIAVRSPDRLWLFHNEDGHAIYQDLMFVVKAHPPSGVSFVALVYPGILTGNGPSMNSRGIIQATNYIGSLRSALGLPRYILGRAILEAKDLAEAVRIATCEPRAYPYHHNLASLTEKRYLSVETVPGAAATREPEGVYLHTNHLLAEQTRSYPHEDQEYKASSSISRMTALQAQLSDLEVATAGPDRFLGMLSSHRNAPYSPCRHPRDEVRGQTLGTAHFDIAKGIFRLCRGNPCQALTPSAWTEYRV